MTRHQLDDTDKAQELLLKLRKIIQQPKWARFQELQSFLGEAEELIEAGSKPPRAASPKILEPAPPPLPEQKTAA